MSETKLSIWSNFSCPAPLSQRLSEALAAHHRVDDLALADVAFGQPDPAACLAAPHLRWIALTSAGYTSYDNGDFRAAMRGRGAVLTTSSMVYSEPCAQHALSFILAGARALPQVASNQNNSRGWPLAPIRAVSRLLGPDDTILLVGYGSIAFRLAQLLAPFGARLLAFRRTPTGKESGPMKVHPIDQIDQFLPQADHVVNLMPANADSAGFFDARRFALMKPDAVFYNIGRGTTVAQDALASALNAGKLRAAFLDVTTPEPLPPGDPLWTAPNCFISPHTAGGHHDEFDRLADHFLGNLRRFESAQPLQDRVI